MSPKKTSKSNAATRMLPFMVTAVILLVAVSAHAAVPGIKGTSFSLTAQANYITQPDGAQIYSWGYGCAPGFTPTFVPYATGAFCRGMQVPGPTLVVTEGQSITVTLANHLPTGAGNTSIVFPGFQVTASGGVAGLLTQEAAPGGTVTYTFTASAPGTHAYHSGTQPNLQIEMGLYGALVVLPSTVPSSCSPLNSDSQLLGMADYRLAPSAYDHAATCYDREYLFQFMELDPRIHRQTEAQINAIASCVVSAKVMCPTGLDVQVEPYHPAYFLVNGRSMPDDMDPSYAPNYSDQPYNGNPHMHPGDMVLLRILGQGRWEHPFHEHANHVRVLARDGNLMLSQTDSAKLAGLMMFTTDTFPGQAMDGLFYWTGKGLGWDIYGHTPPQARASILSATPSTTNGTTTVTIVILGSAPPQIVQGANATISGLNGAQYLAAGCTSVSPTCPILNMPPGYDGTFTITGVQTKTTTVTSPCPTATNPTAMCTQTAVGTAFTYKDNAAASLPAYTYIPGSQNVGNMDKPTAKVSVLIPQTSPDPCGSPDANGYCTSAACVSAGMYYEWCADHNHPLETNPVGQVGAGGPATLPDPLIMTNGLWYNGTPYLGPDAVTRSAGPTPLPPAASRMNPANEAGIAFMWHSHNEREITTNDIFPGGMFMMMLVDYPGFFIDETL